MCLRLEKFCCVFNLKLGAKVVWIWTLLISLALIGFGGWYLYSGSLDQDVDSSKSHQPYEFEKYRAFGGIFLAFGCIWVLILMCFAGAIYAERKSFLIPWLAFMIVTLGGGFAVMVTESIIMNYQSLIILPALLISFYAYAIVFSYYMELRDDKQALNYELKKSGWGSLKRSGF